METTENETRYINGYVRKFAEDVEDTRTIEFVISTPDKDRHKSVLNPKGWKLDNYKRNPIFGYQHNVYGGDMCSRPDPDDILGNSRVFIEGDELIAAATFEPKEENEYAEKIFRKVLRGTLRSASVGFYPLPNKKGKKGTYGSEDDDEHQGGKNETYYYSGQELVEWSIVNIPSNPKAQVKAVRRETANALMFLKRELGFTFAEIENLKVSDVVAMLEDPEKREINIPSLEQIVREALGDKFNEKMTIKGLFVTLKGGDAEEVEQAETGEKVDLEARRKRLHRQTSINKYLDFIMEEQKND